ncbi:PhzF family phenazine biosynthesis protein [Cohnella thailandensis]|uniref:PhzF family phenazine biosynthesis protein n=1 Tax=Cohnella thailandensis TaxID=557557 RepID=A0A841SU81_9BACL|nr:PhzF family phenazine biosynthesis protein [Cohnella thailandensis]MBB6633450.1 PhzF family phenazine biosynthesis protein [Cohnella thailandensis]MBP1974465.1 putative PhzF superfamily epimerase YddE/YHI9 [Cohnella thailandensis]
MHKMFIADAFANAPFRGNPAAVCLIPEGEWPEDEWLQKVAAEMNLSETAFVAPEGDEFRLRWFTPEVEVDLCGHATLATAHILWEQGESRGRLRFRTRSGTLVASRADESIELDLPRLETRRCECPEELRQAIPATVLYCGRSQTDYVLELGSEAEVAALRPDLGLVKRIEARGVIVTAPSDKPERDFVARCFYPAIGIDEDPVTGSAFCALGPYWAERLNKKRLTGEQISARSGFVGVRLSEENRIVLSGRAATVLRGTLG